MRFKSMCVVVFLFLFVAPSFVQGANWISISAMAFIGDADIKIYKNEGISSYLTLETTLGSAWAPVTFPPNTKGKKVVRMEALVYDGSDASYGILDVAHRTRARKVSRLDRRVQGNQPPRLERGARPAARAHARAGAHHGRAGAHAEPGPVAREIAAGSERHLAAGDMGTVAGRSPARLPVSTEPGTVEPVSPQRHVHDGRRFRQLRHDATPAEPSPQPQGTDGPA